MTKLPCKMLVSVKNDSPKSRSWRHFENGDHLAKEVVMYFEDYATTTRKVVPDEEGHIAYTSENIFEFLEEWFDEIVCLVRDEDAEDLWIPYGLSYIKTLIYSYLRSIMEKCRDGDTYRFIDCDDDQMRPVGEPEVILIDENSADIMLDGDENRSDNDVDNSNNDEPKVEEQNTMEEEEDELIYDD